MQLKFGIRSAYNLAGNQLPRNLSEIAHEHILVCEDVKPSHTQSPQPCIKTIKGDRIRFNKKKI